MDINSFVKSALTKFRLGISNLACHRYRYTNAPMNNTIRRLCRSGEENEIHFLLCCPILHDIRKEYIQSKYYNIPCEFRFNALMSTQNKRTLLNLSIYVYKALKRLDLLVS